MSSARQQPSLLDWVVIGISPALIVLMVGSLVFFLVIVLYQGQYSERLLYTLFFFVFAIVLVARISIEQGRATASIYGGGLALATFVALQAFVEYPTPVLRAFSTVITLGLMALVWWSANKLTWDCTHLDEGRKASGRGVLDAAGLDANAAEAKEGRKSTAEDAAEAERERKEEKKRKKDPEGFGGWVARWQRYREAQKEKPHTPGVWVVYFSLAALPLFGLGQSLIDAGDAGRRRTTFILMAVYVGSGLGLLVTTSLLGLRKYLRERGAKIPGAMTAGWLGLGAALILGFLTVGALLPRPHSETPWFGLERAGKKDRNASRYAVVKDGSAGKGDGAAGKKTEAGDGKASGKDGKPGGNSGEKGKGGGKGKDQGGNQGKDGDGGDSKDAGNKNGNEGNDNKKSNDNDRRGDQKNQSGRQSAPNQKDGNTRSGDDTDKNRQGDTDQKQDSDGQSSDSDRSESSSPPQVSEALEKVATGVKWIVWIVLAVLVVAGVVVFFLKFLAPFTNWAKNLLDWLKGLFARQGPKRERGVGGEEAVEAAVERPPPFAAFGNPFADGSAKRMSLEELVEYSFAAFDSWAWDRNRGRQPGETPNEFAARIGHDFPALEEAGWRLANLYARVLYSRAPLPADARAILKAFWDQIERPVYEEAEEEAEVG